MYISAIKGLPPKKAHNRTMELLQVVDLLTQKNEKIKMCIRDRRNAGWLTGATALAKSEDCDGPDLIYLPEVPFRCV